MTYVEKAEIIADAWWAEVDLHPKAVVMVEDPRPDTGFEDGVMCLPFLLITRSLRSLGLAQWVFGLCPSFYLYHSDISGLMLVGCYHGLHFVAPSRAICTTGLIGRLERVYQSTFMCLSCHAHSLKALNILRLCIQFTNLN